MSLPLLVARFVALSLPFFVVPSNTHSQHSHPAQGESKRGPERGAQKERYDTFKLTIENIGTGSFLYLSSVLTPWCKKVTHTTAFLRVHHLGHLQRGQRQLPHQQACRHLESNHSTQFIWLIKFQQHGPSRHPTHIPFLFLGLSASWPSPHRAPGKILIPFFFNHWVSAATNLRNASTSSSNSLSSASSSQSISFSTVLPPSECSSSFPPIVQSNSPASSFLLGAQEPAQWVQH